MRLLLTNQRTLQMTYGIRFDPHISIDEVNGTARPDLVKVVVQCIGFVWQWMVPDRPRRRLVTAVEMCHSRSYLACEFRVAIDQHINSINAGSRSGKCNQRTFQYRSRFAARHHSRHSIHPRAHLNSAAGFRLRRRRSHSGAMKKRSCSAPRCPLRRIHFSDAAVYAALLRTVNKSMPLGSP